MGIPKMFRFLSERYPLILQPLQEHQRFDHFYLDMNGIIHTCTHPDDAEIPNEDEDEMFKRIFQFTDALYRIVAPRKLLFLAVDGVAPRAKMNQQRSRRFRSAKDAERAMAEAVARGEELPAHPFDSNCITPGTSFMYALSSRFRSWIDDKMRNYPAWQQGCNVVFSGPEVPGEGEHKIMDYIRAWQGSTAYNPNIRHCMYGLDADLMMLGLVTHAPHFTLIREKLRYVRGGSRRAPNITGTEADADEFQLLEVSMLRDMLFLEFRRADNEEDIVSRQNYRGRGRGRGRGRSRTPSPEPLTTAQMRAAIREAAPGQDERVGRKQFKLVPSRIVDDFVFMCMLVGNDFLPHLPHLDIDQGAIELMFRVYRRMLPTWGGYLTDKHRLHPARLEEFIQQLRVYEATYFADVRARTDGLPEYATPGYRGAYYREKFGLDINDGSFGEKLMQLRTVYIEALHWVLQYYHNGVSSWNWYYPGFYALLASDLVALNDISVRFQRGTPFSPLTQLMAVLPPESATFLPEPMARLMLRPDSPVADFYPTDFVTDPNGKRNSWEAVVIVPFIDEQRLLSAVNSINEAEFTSEEIERNKTGTANTFRAVDYPSVDYAIPPMRSSKFKPRDPARRTQRSVRGRGRGRGGPSQRGRIDGGSSRMRALRHGDESRSSTDD